MKVVEHLDRATRPLVSFEIIPPLRGGTARSVFQLVEDLMPYDPPFIDVTSHPAEVEYKETPQGIRRKVKRKRPGTLGICALIQNKYNIDAVPHILCNGFTKEETEDFLIELNYLGIDNVLAVQGDREGLQKPKQSGHTHNRYAIDLVSQIADLNRGRYLEDDILNSEPAEFCIGIAGYPEKHFEAPNLASDIRHARAKLDAGAHYIVTQMFFDNRHYFEFVDACRTAGITAPIIPGLKILSFKSQLRSIPRRFYVDIPEPLSEEIEKAPKDQVMDIGVEWSLGQIRELLDHGVPGAHFYVMLSSTAVCRLMDRLDL